MLIRHLYQKKHYSNLMDLTDVLHLIGKTDPIKSSAELIIKAASIERNIRITTLLSNIIAEDSFSSNSKTDSSPSLRPNPIMEGRFNRRSSALSFAITYSPASQYTLRCQANGPSLLHHQAMASQPVPKPHRVFLPALWSGGWRVLQRRDSAIRMVFSARQGVSYPIVLPKRRFGLLHD